MPIHYIQNREIDFVRWDKCVEAAVNGNLYSYSWFLKAVCSNWDALILDDYKAVFPLPYIEKYGKKLLMHSKLIAYTGIQSSVLFDPSLTDQFISAIPPAFERIDIVLNNMNITSNFATSVSDIGCYNIDLISSYSHHTRKYSPLMLDTFSQLEVNKLTIISGLQAYDLISLYIRNPSFSPYKLSENEINALRIIATSTIKTGSGELIGIYDYENNLSACALFVGANQKTHLLFYAQSAEGYKTKQLYLLIDFFIRKHAEKNTTLSLLDSYSNILAYDFKNLGAQLFYLPRLFIDKLPWYLRGVV